MQKSKALAGIISCFLIFSSFIIFYNQSSKASGHDLWVDIEQRYPDAADGSIGNPFKFIGDAIDAASDGDTIKVLPGVYGEILVIDKSVTITNDDRANTIIYSGTQNPYAIQITADSVSLEGFNITDATTTAHRKAVIYITSGADNVRVIDNLIENSANGYAIHVDGGQNTIIKNNTINNGRGIKVDNSNSNSIHGNYIDTSGNSVNGYYALQLSSSNNNRILENIFLTNTYGIYAQTASYNSIENNTIVGSSSDGIMIKTGGYNNIQNNNIYSNGNNGINIDTSYSYIINNMIGNNNIGLSIAASDCTIRNNRINDSTAYGVYARPGSSNNKFFNNTFTTNLAYQAKEEGNNQWDNGTVGNYWYDFYGPDPSNPNNLVPYDGENVPAVYKYTRGGVNDNYPKGVYQKQPTVSNPSPTNLEEGVDRRPVLSVIVTNPDPQPYTEPLDVYFYYLLNNTANLIEVKRDIESGATASVAFSSTIQGKNAVYSYLGLGYAYIGVWFVEVEDSYSRIRSPVWIFTTNEPPVNNTKPTASFKVQQDYLVENEVHARMNDNIQFDASESNDPDGEIIFYRWSFGDETTAINEITPTHKYANPGEYTINLAVIDDDGSSNTMEIAAIIGDDSNRAPSAIISVSSEGYVGDSILFSSSSSSDPDSGDTIAEYLWNFGDGYTSVEQNPTHQYSSTGTYTVTLVVADQSGEEGTTSVTISIKIKQDGGLPGFESITVIITLIGIAIIYKKKKR